MKNIPDLNFFGYVRELANMKSYITIVDNSRAVIENCRRICECTEIMVKVITGSFEIEIWGSELKLSNFAENSVEVNGKIEQVRLLSGSVRKAR
jgi:hypothetical protein